MSTFLTPATAYRIGHCWQVLQQDDQLAALRELPGFTDYQSRMRATMEDRGASPRPSENHAAQTGKTIPAGRSR